MTNIIKNISYAKGLILNPEVFFRKLKLKEIPISFPLAIYIAYIFFYSLFLKFKPINFPQEMEFLAAAETSFLFYFGIQIFWGTIISAIFSAFAALLIRLFSTTKFAIGATLCVLIILASVYAFTTFDKALVKCALLAIFAGAALLSAIKMKNGFIFLLKAGFAIDLIIMLFLPLNFLAVFLKSENLFLAAQTATAAWIILLFVKAAKTIANISVLKSIILYGFASIITAGMLYIMFRSNLMSDTVFKALLLT